MASCFYPKAVDEHGRGRKRVDEHGRMLKLASILHVRTDRHGHSVRKEQIHHVGTGEDSPKAQQQQQQHGRSKSFPEKALQGPLTTLVDHIHSISQRFPSSVMPTQSRRAWEGATEAMAADDNRRKGGQSVSFRKLRSKRTPAGDDDSAGASEAAAASPHEKEQQQNDLSADEGSSRGKSYWMSQVDNWAVFPAPDSEAGNLREKIQENDSSVQQRGGGGQLKPPHAKTGAAGSTSRSHDLENPQFSSDREADFSIQLTTALASQHESGFVNRSGGPMVEGGKAADGHWTRPPEPKSDWERVLERTLAQMNGGEALIAEIEEEKADVVELAQSSRAWVPDCETTSRPVHHGGTFVAAIESERKPDKSDVDEVGKLAANSRWVPDWDNMSRPMHHGGAFRTQIESDDKSDKPDQRDFVELAQSSHPAADWPNRSRSVNHGGTSITELVMEKPDKIDHKVDESTTRNSQPVADRHNMSRSVQHGRSSITEIEEEKPVDEPDRGVVELAQNPQTGAAENWKNTSRKTHHNRTSVCEIEEETPAKPGHEVAQSAPAAPEPEMEGEDEEKACKRDHAHGPSISQRVSLWLGRSRPAGHTKSAPAVAQKLEKADVKREEDIAPLAPYPQCPETPVSAASTSPRTAKDVEKAHSNGEKGIITVMQTAPNGAPNSPPVLASQTKLAVDLINPADPGMVKMKSAPSSEPDVSPDAARLSSVSEAEAVARIWEQLDLVDDEEAQAAAHGDAPEAVQAKLQLATGKPEDVAPAPSTTRVRRTRVRFWTGGGGEDSSVVDISATLLDKLSAAKHLQVRCLRDELEQTRAQVAQLERDLRAERDWKLAFELQAARQDAALKDVREPRSPERTVEDHAEESKDTILV